MKPILVVATVVAALALPAGAAPPPEKALTRLKHQVATLHAKVAQLQKANTLSTNFTQGVVGVLMHRIGLGDKCPLTVPNLKPPPGQPIGVPHGNGKLWVGTWPSNVVFQKPQADGSIGAKFGWYRQCTGSSRSRRTGSTHRRPPLGRMCPAATATQASSRPR